MLCSAACMASPPGAPRRACKLRPAGLATRNGSARAGVELGSAVSPLAWLSSGPVGVCDISTRPGSPSLQGHVAGGGGKGLARPRIYKRSVALRGVGPPSGRAPSVGCIDGVPRVETTARGAFMRKRLNQRRRASRARRSIKRPGMPSEMLLFATEGVGAIG